MSRVPYTSTTNACKLCTPLGAALVFKGIEGGVPFLHGSQGCATYMRRYIISHFREPMDIASSALGEKHAVYGGGPNLKKGLLNVMKKYSPALIGVASTCLTETIGDDVQMILHEFRKEFGDLELPEIVHCSTPSYMGTHMEGWHRAVRAIVDQMVTDKAPPAHAVNILPSLVSPADIRHLRELCAAFGIAPVILPDISDTLDGTAKEDYEPIPEGGTPLAAIRGMSGARATIQFGRTLAGRDSAGESLRRRFGVPCHTVGMPIGIRESDAFFAALEEAAGVPMPREVGLERGRLVDAMVDAHKYVFGKRVVVYGEEDLVVGLTAFLAEIGMKPVLVATGARNMGLEKHIADVCADVAGELPEIHEGVDFHDIAERSATLAPDLMVGHSKGYRYARDWNVPLIRVGFPIHDRFGGQRMLHIGYRGALALLDRIVNAILEKKQEDSPIGYVYL